MQAHTAAVIAAAGKGSRLGYLKAHLQINNRFVIDNLCQSLALAKISHVYLSLPRSLFIKGDFKYLALNQKLMISLNFFDDRGILGSVQSALKQCSQASGIFVLPVDQPFVSYKLLLAMQQSAQIKYNNPSIILVNYYIESGHPVYFSRHFFSELNSCHENFGMRGLIVRHKKYVHQLFWPDARILSNINTAKDLGHIIKTSGEAKTLCCTSDIKLHSL